MDQTEIVREARLLAIENLITRLYVDLFIGQEMSADEVRMAHTNWIAAAQTQRLPMQHPAIADHLAAEHQLALERLLRGQREMLAQALNQARED